MGIYILYNIHVLHNWSCTIIHIFKSVISEEINIYIYIKVKTIMTKKYSIKFIKLF